MLVGWPAALHLPLKGAFDIKIVTRLAWRAAFVALYTLVSILMVERNKALRNALP